MSNQEVQNEGENMAVFDPSIEPLLRENPNRFVIFPIQYPQIWKMYKQVKNVQNAKKNLNSW